MGEKTQPEKLKFAVFIVAYNAVNTLRKVLDRIPTDTWDDLAEVYVFDDASTDDTVLLGEGYKSTRGLDKLKIYRKLGVTTRTEAVTKGLAQGMIVLEKDE